MKVFLFLIMALWGCQESSLTGLSTEFPKYCSSSIPTDPLTSQILVVLGQDIAVVFGVRVVVVRSIFG